MIEFPRIPDSELDFDSDLVFTLEGVAFSGIAFEEDPEGGVSEVTYREGRQEGPARDLYPSGAVRAESTYREDVLHGRSREFGSDGRLTTESWHEYGILVRRRQFDDAGTPTEEHVIDPASEEFRLLSRYRRERAWPT